MMGFREYIIETADLDEAIAGKGALALYATRQKSLRDSASRHFQTSVQDVNALPHPATEQDYANLLVKSQSTQKTV